MSPKTDNGVCVFGAAVLRRFLIALLQEIDGVREAKDIEYIHRMRVASRRLRTALPLFSDCLPRKKFPEWQDAVRAITKALGSARDLDVQIDTLNRFLSEAQDLHYRPGLVRLLLRLGQKRSARQVSIEEALNTLETSGVIAGLQKRLAVYEQQQSQTYLYTPALYQLGYASITTRLEDFLSYESCVDHPEEVERLHAMRIAAKHLRYTMEIFAPLYPGELKDPIQAARKAQDLLGEIHDCDVWTSMLPAFLQNERGRILKFYGVARGYSRMVPGIQAFLANRQKRREENYLDFSRFWTQHQEKNTWNSITQTIQIPYYRVEPPVLVVEIPPQPEPPA